MTTLEELLVSPGRILVWLIVGLIAGWLAARIMKGGGYGLVGDLIVGVIGAMIGGVLFALIVTAEAGLLASIVVATLGAGILIAVFRFLGFGSPGI